MHFLFEKKFPILNYDDLGSFFQSIVSLTNLLMTTVVAKVFSNTLIFLLQKCEQLMCSHFFQPKNINVFAIFQDRIFNVTLANNFVKFLTNGPRCFSSILSYVHVVCTHKKWTIISTYTHFSGNIKYLSCYP